VHGCGPACVYRRAWQHRGTVRAGVGGLSLQHSLQAPDAQYGANCPYSTACKHQTCSMARPVYTAQPVSTEAWTDGSVHRGDDRAQWCRSSSPSPPMHKPTCTVAQCNQHVIWATSTHSPQPPLQLVQLFVGRQVVVRPAGTHHVATWMADLRPHPHGQLIGRMAHGASHTHPIASVRL
jgi:hypothetical protein